MSPPPSSTTGAPRRRAEPRRGRRLRRGTPTASADFDEFYVGTRRRVLLQAFVLTGDRAAAVTGTREAYVAAYRSWRKVARLERPEDWVRPRAWSIAHRRRLTHLRHREKGLDPRQVAVLAALEDLGDQQRRTLILTHLAALSLAEIGREIGETRVETEKLLQKATTATALRLDCDSALLRPELARLAPVIGSERLPRVAAIRRSARQRGRQRLAAGTALAVALTLASGWFVLSPDQSPTSQAAARGVQRASERPVSAAMLVTPEQLSPIGTPGQWQITGTGRNLTGSGLHSVCQRSRFADVHGLVDWVRTADGPAGRRLVQSVEVSLTPSAARRAYRTTVDWYAGCRHAQVQLAHGDRVDGLGERAVGLDLDVPGARGSRYLVVVAGSGQVTTTTLLATNQPGDSTTTVADVAASALGRLCRASAVGRCAAAPTLTPELPPSGEDPGLLAVVDLPAITDVTRPWVGATPVTGGPNLAATNCDHADLQGPGRSTTSRTYLIPGAGLPARFGLTETRAHFASVTQARRFVATISARLADCHRRQLGSHVTSTFGGRSRDTSYAGWRVENELRGRLHRVTFWMGLVRRGSDVAQVGFAPAGGVDLDRTQFRALVVRARDRLAELPS